MVDPLSLKELNILIKTVLDANLDPTYWIVAEIGELRLNPRGHCYLELVEKDEHSVISKMRANIWANTYSNISTWFESVTGESLKKDLKVMLNVSIQFHELYGMSLIVKDIDPRFTLGERAKQKQEVLRQLQDDGILEMNRDLELTIVPQRIAVISSATAAGYGDFIKHLENNINGYYFQCTLFQSLMQGNGAEKSIIESLHKIHESGIDFDCLVIVRGGGSQIDLDCFDSYELSANIAQFPLPIITGIGHERDQSIVDLVAHTSMKTPTAVAEFFLNKSAAFEFSLKEAYTSILSNADYVLSDNYNKLEALFQRINQSVIGSLLIENSNTELLNSKIKILSPRIVENENHKLNHFQQSIKLSNPKTILARGYTISKINGKLIKHLKGKIKNGDILETITDSSILKSKIESK